MTDLPRCGHTCYAMIFCGQPAKVAKRDCKACTPTLTETVQTGEDTFEEEEMTRLCFDCGGYDGVERDVIATGVAGRADPTAFYNLRCGHSTIDV